MEDRKIVYEWRVRVAAPGPLTEGRKWEKAAPDLRLSCAGGAVSCSCEAGYFAGAGWKSL
jgi:hypothetical protein